MQQWSTLEADETAAEAERLAAASGAAGQALETLCRLFFEHTRLSVTPLPAHFSRLVLGLLPRVEVAQRSEVARRLAHSEALPREIASALASDLVEVAGPILRQSPVLEEEQLLAAAGGEIARARCVAARTNLPRSVALMLGRRRDPSIAEEMLSGPAFPIDPEVAELLAESSGLSPASAERLVIWSELSDAALARLFWAGAPPIRRVIVERLARRGNVTAGASGQVQANLELGTALFAAAASRRWPDIVAQLGAALEIPRSLAQKLVEDPGCEPLVVACRAAGVGVSQLTSLLVLMPSASGSVEPQSHIRDLVAVAERLPAGVAGNLVRLWAAMSAPVRPSLQSSAASAPRAAQPGARRHALPASPRREGKTAGG